MFGGTSDLEKSGSISEFMYIFFQEVISDKVEEFLLVNDYCDIKIKCEKHSKLTRSWIQACLETSEWLTNKITKIIFWGREEWKL